jgi:membrane-associated phospholipid phosphatase
MLDIIAWLPYGVIHFVLPFAVAAFLFLFRSPQSLHLWARTFGYMNLAGVIIQLILPCSPPWYELIHGLTPANYAMRGSPGGLARIDALFHTQGYTIGFTNSPLVFGAFPSLHSGNATLEALFLSHFFPHSTRYIWAYASVLYWATMYLTHHYLIDVVSGACLATAFFYFFLPDEMKGAGAASSPNLGFFTGRRNKYELYDIEVPRGEPASSGLMLSARDFDPSSEPSSDEEVVEIPYRSPLPNYSSFASNGHAAPDHYSQSHTTSSHSKTPNGGRGSARGRGHRHTASIASLIRGEERGPEDGWSPVGPTFVFGSSNTTGGRARTD